VTWGVPVDAHRAQQDDGEHKQREPRPALRDADLPREVTPLDPYKPKASASALQRGCNERA